MKWTQQEIQLLYQLIDQQSDADKRSWVQISQQIQTKSARQCYDYYITHSKQGDGEKYHKWTDQEEKLLIYLKNSLKNWKDVQTHFPGLTLNQLKNRFRDLVEKNQKNANIQMIVNSSNNGKPEKLIQQSESKFEFQNEQQEQYRMSTQSHYQLPPLPATTPKVPNLDVPTGIFGEMFSRQHNNTNIINQQIMEQKFVQQELNQKKQYIEDNNEATIMNQNQSVSQLKSVNDINYHNSATNVIIPISKIQSSIEINQAQLVVNDKKVMHITNNPPIQNTQIIINQEKINQSDDVQHDQLDISLIKSPIKPLPSKSVQHNDDSAIVFQTIAKLKTQEQQTQDQICSEPNPIIFENKESRNENNQVTILKDAKSTVDNSMHQKQAIQSSNAMQSTSVTQQQCKVNNGASKIMEQTVKEYTNDVLSQKQPVYIEQRPVVKLEYERKVQSIPISVSTHLNREEQLKIQQDHEQSEKQIRQINFKVENIKAKPITKYVNINEDSDGDFHFGFEGSFLDFW